MNNIKASYESKQKMSELKDEKNELKNNSTFNNKNNSISDLEGVNENISFEANKESNLSLNLKHIIYQNYITSKGKNNCILKEKILNKNNNYYKVNSSSQKEKNNKLDNYQICYKKNDVDNINILVKKPW